MDYPHGNCECNECDVCNIKPGPAAYAIIRDGRSMIVCTRCVLSIDKHVVCIVKKTTNPLIYLSYDPLGFQILNSEVKDQESLN